MLQQVAGTSFSQRCENNLLTTLYNIVFTLCVCWVPANDTIAKSPVYVARDIWNSLPAPTRNIADQESFKTTVRNMVKTDYIEQEEAKLLAGLF